jgi:hypothetical protein
MNNFDLAPGPLIGNLLAIVKEAHASGELSTKEEALALVRRELSAVSKQQISIHKKSRDSGAKTIPNAK